MDEPEATAELVQRLRSGDPQAATEIFARYARRLTRLAEQHLSQKLAARVGGSDVVQSVFRTFFRRSAAGEFQIDSSNQMWQLLVTITLRKVRNQARHHTAGKRAVATEAAGDDQVLMAEMMARDPGPEEAVELIDRIETLLRDLPPFFGDVLELRLAGYNQTEIATRLEVSRASVYRALQLLQERLTEDSADGT